MLAKALLNTAKWPLEVQPNHFFCAIYPTKLLWINKNNVQVCYFDTVPATKRGGRLSHSQAVSRMSEKSRLAQTRRRETSRHEFASIRYRPVVLYFELDGPFSRTDLRVPCSDELFFYCDGATG